MSGSDGGLALQAAADADLRLAISAIGSNAQYGGMIQCALAGIYAERAAAYPIIRARVLTEVLAAITKQREGMTSLGVWDDGYETGVDYCETAVRGLARVEPS